MSSISSKQPLTRVSSICAIATLFFLSLTTRTLAHHALGGRLPVNGFEGFFSGLAHPIIGLDHFAFVVASGLLAVGLENGILIPVAFVFATLMGTGIHLQKLDLFSPELMIALSVITFGLLLSLKSRFSGNSNLYTIGLATLGIIAGVFHGYAYGESIVGAQMTPLVSYLAGFALIQLAIACGAFFGGRLIKEKFANKSVNVMQFLGLLIAGVGGVFLMGIK
ncbi:MAG: hypothetical protein N5P05_002407 [Chroococcopsis gigantea SAG 12.99]|jgi:urease accessory protein|nr:HupE/UreJ family protein [Chlorogloea purpurea SAG 13.99]MDV3000801.1 hypothetical protein [Chroococcopsis gigantea SAG 12.99]